MTLFTRKSLLGTCGFLCSADDTRVKRVFGSEQGAVAVEADKQRGQAEKGRKRPRRSPDRGGNNKETFKFGNTKSN